LLQRLKRAPDTFVTGKAATSEPAASKRKPGVSTPTPH
jgi:hypothetical protein